ncbi:ssDNA-binding domain-containing protein [Xanthomonas euvesicatoria pv. allii]|uniref:ArdC-like ssDNA-binding domain-containing protein n=1 Tax=Xanthomonas euvesicatoria TaxID=456327 RepID=UPI002404F3F9|nr:ArdC-like ssDNA-binding domain-containing protein [Xanthomonas euvesicatoria]MCP3050725.1 ssDNA-binding domain-containing protein [Xanthomonas euvesicatoria pv. allii]
MNTRNHEHQQRQEQKPAKTSSKAAGSKRKRWSKGRARDVAEQALMNAVGQSSTANYAAIVEGFLQLGIAPEDIRPRENIFTFNAWRALGRVVRRGQHGVRVVTVLPCTKKDAITGIELDVKKVRRTTVFHISQTDLLEATEAVA